MKRKPKFRVGELVFSRMHERNATIRKVVFDQQFEMYGYFLSGLPMYWLEYNLRPLTKRERGPERKS